MRARNPFKRAVRVPPEILTLADLAHGERVLAGTLAADGTWLLGTRDAFLAVSEQAPTRIPWEHVERADWDRDEERFTISEVGEFGHERPRHKFTVSEPGLLLELVRERVTASVVLQRRVPVEGVKGFVVVGRRAPKGDSDVIWAYEFDPGVEPENPAVMARAEAALRAAKEELGG